LEQFNNTVLVALNDSVSSRRVLDFLSSMALCPEDWKISLLHFFKKPSASEELMGRKFTEEQPERMKKLLERAQEKLIESGYHAERIEYSLITDPYPTVADGIIDQAKKRRATMVIIGRKKMSKAEEFVKGDISVKLVRALEGTAVLVVKSL
jgi:nucleotide-binding universal stress UspA family protein